jgi:hypothetical protein
MAWGDLNSAQHVPTFEVQSGVSTGALRWSGSPVSGVDSNLYWTRALYASWIAHDSAALNTSGILDGQHMTKVQMLNYAAFPLTPPVLQLVSSQNFVQLSWAQIIDATSYALYRSTSAKVQPDSFDLVSSNVSSPYSDFNVSAGVTYYYWLTASSAAGTSDYSNRVSATVTASVTTPQNFQGTGVVEYDAFFNATAFISNLSWSNGGISQSKTLQVFNTNTFNWVTLSSTITTEATAFQHVMTPSQYDSYSNFGISGVEYRIRFNNSNDYANTTVVFPF